MDGTAIVLSPAIISLLAGAIGGLGSFVAVEILKQTEDREKSLRKEVTNLNDLVQWLIKAGDGDQAVHIDMEGNSWIITKETGDR